MLDWVNCFSDIQLAFLWEQSLLHYWLTCFSIPMGMNFKINFERMAKRNLLESSISHAAT